MAMHPLAAISLPPLSVIIPVLNEAASLPHLLRQLTAQEGISFEAIVADGGSRDGSAELARQLGARVIDALTGRARQMNAATEAASHDLLLFLHADSSLDHGALIHDAVKCFQQAKQGDGNKLAGHFSLVFQRSETGKELAYRYLEVKSASNRPQTINGDQGLLISRSFLQRLGGFDETLPFMEDQALAKRIFDEGKWLLLPGSLGTSARRFEREGFHRRYILMGLIMAFYWSGNRDFFRRAREVYPEQSRSQRLRLWPYFHAMWAVLLKDLGPIRAGGLLYRFGRYGLENLWQVFLFADTLLADTLLVHTAFAHTVLGRARQPLTSFHDRWLQPVLKNRVLGFLLALPAALLLGFAYLGVLGPAFFCLERIEAARAQPADEPLS